MLNRSYKQLASEQEVLSFEIVLDAKLSDETKETLEELKNASSSDSETTEDEWSWRSCPSGIRGESNSPPTAPS